VRIRRGIFCDFVLWRNSGILSHSLFTRQVFDSQVGYLGFLFCSVHQLCTRLDTILRVAYRDLLRSSTVIEVVKQQGEEVFLLGSAFLRYRTRDAMHAFITLGIFIQLDQSQGMRRLSLSIRGRENGRRAVTKTVIWQPNRDLVWTHAQKSGVRG
jgi:hypothetical protein